MLKSIVIAFVLFSFAYFVNIVAITAPSGNFTVEPDTVYFNWTNGTINITANTDNIILVVKNDSTLSGVYGQAGCNRFIVQNESGDYTNSTQPLNATNWTLMFLTADPMCLPGRYTGNITIYNSVNFSDNISNLTAIVDILIPINDTKLASFAGSFTKNQSYHAYWFWTNASQNLTWLTLKLVGLGGDLDLFLTDSNLNLIERSINRSTGSEEIVARLPDSGQLWSAIVYGNASSAYSGLLYFSSLNTSNASDGSQIQSVDFGLLDPNSTGSAIINISNTDDEIVWNANLDKQIWHVDSWPNNAGPASFSLLVPNFTQKLRIGIVWNGTGRWNLTVRDPAGNLINSSSDRWANVNVSGMQVEEYIEYSGSFASKQGFWNITVENLTASPASYNVTAWLWFNASEWLTTNFTNGFDFNSSGLDNSSVVVELNLTVPNRRLLNGSYGGFIDLANSSSTWKVRLPVKFSVKAGTLIVNGNMSSSVVRKSWNVGYNATIPFNITINNTGGYDVYISYANSSFLNLTSTNYMNLTIDSAPVVIPAGGSDYLTFNVTVNTLQAQNTGTYKGWILFNTTNATANSSSYPYELFNLTVEVNLTDGLIVDVVSISPDWVGNTSQTQNITFEIKVSLVNGTIISTSPMMGISNFTRIWINESNASAYGYVLSNITDSQKISPFCSGGTCFVNATTTAGMVGGRYTVYASVKWWNGVVNLTGTGSDGPLIINATGLYLSGPTSLSTIDEGSSTKLNVSVYNWGPVKATGTLSISGCSGIATASFSNVSAGCGSPPALDIDGNGTEFCWFEWTITGQNVSGDKNCTFTLTTSDRAFNNLSVSLTVRDLQAQQQQEQQQQQEEQPTYQPALSILTWPTNLSAYIGGSNSSTVVVKNTGTLSGIVKLNVSIDSGITATVSPESCTIAVGANCSFTVSFAVANTSTLGSRSGTFTAYVSTSPNIKDSKSFTFTVLATESKQAELNASYQNYLAMFANYSEQITELERSGFVSATNLSKVKILLEESNTTLAVIADAIAAGNWSEVERLLTELNITMARIGDEIVKLQSERQAGEQTFWSSMWIWAGVAVVVMGTAAFIVYLLLPPKAGWHPTKGFRPPRERLHKKIKKLFTSKKQ